MYLFIYLSSFELDSRPPETDAQYHVSYHKITFQSQRFSTPLTCWNSPLCRGAGIELWSLMQKHISLLMFIAYSIDFYRLYSGVTRVSRINHWWAGVWVLNEYSSWKIFPFYPFLILHVRLTFLCYWLFKTPEILSDRMQKSCTFWGLSLLKCEIDNFVHY